ncbi:hypothetical protein BGZ70_003087 [Mortierella alpina]|uniref:F-box domain-containing protein n=1 Tax=Mortierella alpina TaxID=64518 RepID=A0A9P6JBD4_MORAP|nr:hypothetical protein BGZ70_003087 [Mortierella alpina]
MPRSAAHTVLATPELALLVSARLAQSDLAHCISVCKDWSRHFEPILWTTFCLKERPCESLINTALKSALARNLPLIRTLEIAVANDNLLKVLANGSADPSTLCTNLKSITLEDFQHMDLDLTSQYLASLFILNHGLTHLRLVFECFDTGAVPIALSRLESLQHLTIYSSRECEGNRTILMLLQACLPLPNLAELCIDLDLLWDDDAESFGELETIIKAASIARCARHPSSTKIESLQLPSNRSGTPNPLPLLLFESDLLDLVSCEIPWFDAEASMGDIERLIRERCPNLKHVRLTYLSDTSQYIDDRKVRSVIHGCSGLQSFVSQHFNDEGPNSAPRCIMRDLTSEHSQTLEVLDLTDCSLVYSDDLQEFLTECRQLKQLWVMNSSRKGSNIGISSVHIRTQDWVCMELTKLGLTIDRFPEVEDVFGELEVVGEPAVDGESEKDAITRLHAIAAKSVYTQIGRLEKLEVLALDRDTGPYTLGGDYSWDLTLSKGWLGEMAGLKRLKTLTLQGVFWSKMGQAEVEFMHEHWPLLREINLYGNSLPLGPQSPWRWLLNKRPQLSLVVTP